MEHSSRQIKLLENDELNNKMKDKMCKYKTHKTTDRELQDFKKHGVLVEGQALEREFGSGAVLCLIF